MKNIFIIGLLTLLLVACQNEPKIDYAVLSGKIENNKINSATIIKGDFEKEIAIKDDGTFTDTLKISENGFYTMYVGRSNTVLYMTMGDNIKVNADGTKFNGSLNYTGDKSVENNYLAQKAIHTNEATGNVVSFYSKEENDFKSTIDAIKAEHESRLAALTDADEDFKTKEANNIVFDYYEKLRNYVQRHGYYTQNEAFEPSKGFIPEELENMTYDNIEAYGSSMSYKNLAINSTLENMFEQIPDINLATVEDLQLMNDLKIPQMKNDIIDYMGTYLVSPGNENMESIYNFLLTQTTSDKMKTKLTEAFEKNKDLVRGKPSPEFVNYENHKGGKTSLSDLKGQFVYVDVWATWCGPCIREIPSLKKVEEQFHDENIAFVSASIDELRNRDKWFNMVNEKELGGIQIMADKAWQSDFVQGYGIDGIPRFILIDPDGNIISADAPRPSNPKLVEMLETELNL